MPDRIKIYEEPSVTEFATTGESGQLIQARSYYNQIRTQLQAYTSFQSFDSSTASDLAKNITAVIYGVNPSNVTMSGSTGGNVYGLQSHKVQVANNIKELFTEHISETNLAYFAAEINTIVGNSISQVNTENFLRAVGRIIKEVKYKDDIFVDPNDFNFVEESKIERLKTALMDNNFRGANYILQLLGKSLATIGAFLLQVGLPLSAPCILGPLPLRHIDSLEVAHSGKVLKYRASGSLFLAQQLGGNDAIRIEGYLTRSEAVLFTFFIWILFLYGRGVTKDMEDFADKENWFAKISSAINFNILSGTAGNVTTFAGLLAARTAYTDLKNYDSSIERPSWEHHYTFPFVTRHVIIPNCYIETFSFEDRVVDGKDVLSYTIMLRTYTKPETFDEFNMNQSSEKWVGIDAVNRTNMLDVVRFSSNLLLRMVMANDYIVDNTAWRVGMHNSPLAADQYYDIDFFDVAATFSLGIGGIVGT